MDDTGSTQLVRSSNEQLLYNKLKPAVWVTTEQTSEGISTGTGFCIDPKGLIMTCSHCVKEQVLVSTQGGKKLRKAVLLHRVEPWDIAVLCLKEDLSQPSSNKYPHVSLAKDGTLVPGQDVYAVGHQNRLMYSFSGGKIGYPCSNTVNQFAMSSATSKQSRVLFSTTSEYRTAKEVCAADMINLCGDLPLIEIMNIHLSSGGSGSPIVLPSGEVVGMMTLQADSKCHAVHVSALQIALKKANEEYNKLVSSLRAKLDDQEKLKYVEKMTESDKSKEI